MRLIDADALIEFMDGRLFDLREMYGNYDHYTDGFECALCLAEDATTIDAVPVVRCRDCKYNSEAKAIGEDSLWCDYWAIDPDENDFCSYGERRSDE